MSESNEIGGRLEGYSSPLEKLRKRILISVEIARDEGISKFVGEIKGFLEYYYLYRFKTYRKIRKKISSELKGYEPYPHPMKIIWVDPSKIKYVSEETGRWGATGAIIEGDWDKSNVEFINYVDDIYSAFEYHFQDEVDWEDTEFIKTAIEETNKGKVVWNQCTSVSDIKERCGDLDDLYNKIENNGYKTRGEIISNKQHDVMESRDKKLPTHLAKKDEITVSIGRDGRFLWEGNGTHRLTIAKVLNLDKVPVRIVARHEQWQKVRKEIAQAEKTCHLSSEYKKYIEHPDIK